MHIQYISKEGEEEVGKERGKKGAGLSREQGKISSLQLRFQM